MRGGRLVWASIVAALVSAGASASDPIAKPEVAERTLPINFATALQLANAKPIDIRVAEQLVTIASRQLDRAQMLWIPNLVVGADFYRHEGAQQDVPGNTVRSDRSSSMLGFGPNVVFNLSDAIYGPLAAKQDLKARRAAVQTATNDSMLAVAEAYFYVQQARGELAGALLAAQRAEEVGRKVAALDERLEASRAKVELARRQQAATAARERWRTASAELGRLLRLEPGTLIEPMEPPFLAITVVPDVSSLDALIPIGLTNRPELQGQQAFVQATLTRLKQEKIRPLVPSLALRGASTNPEGSLAYGGFAKRGDPLGSRFDLDLQILWEFQSLGFGNRAKVGERQAEHQIATLELFRTQDRIAAEIAAAHARVKSSSERMAQAEPALKEALVLVEKSLEGMNQTRRVGEADLLVVRPQEVIAAVQSLGQANADFYAAVGDFNRSQFRLYRALGHPAQCLPATLDPEKKADPTPLPLPPSPGKMPSFLPAVPIPAPAEDVSLVSYRPNPRRTDWPPVALSLLQNAAKRPVTLETAEVWSAPKPLPPAAIPATTIIVPPKILPPPLEDPTEWTKPANPRK